MAKNKPKPKPKKKGSSKTILKLPCAFTGCNYGKKTAKIGVEVSRDEMTLNEADNNLCDRRLYLTIHANGQDDQKGQGRFEGMADDLDITSAADVKGFRVDSANIKFGLTFSKVELKKLSAKAGFSLEDFVTRVGEVQITEVDDIPDDAPEDDADKSAEEEATAEDAATS